MLKLTNIQVKNKDTSEILLLLNYGYFDHISVIKKNLPLTHPT